MLTLLNDLDPETFAKWVYEDKNGNTVECEDYLKNITDDIKKLKTIKL